MITVSKNSKGAPCVYFHNDNSEGEPMPCCDISSTAEALDALEEVLQLATMLNEYITAKGRMTEKMYLSTALSEFWGSVKNLETKIKPWEW